MSLEERIDLTMFNEYVAEDDNFEIFEDLEPVPSPTSSTTNPVNTEFATSEGDAPPLELPRKTRKKKRCPGQSSRSRSVGMMKKRKFQALEQRMDDLEQENRKLKQQLQTADNVLAILRYIKTNKPNRMPSGYM